MSQISHTINASPTATETKSTSRTRFLRTTYLHLTGAIAFFALLTALVQLTPLAGIITSVFFGSQLTTFVIFLGFVFVSSLSQRWSLSATSKPAQYFGLGVYILVETLFFTPIIFIFTQGAPALLALAIAGTAVVTAMLTLIAFTSGINFSFLRSFLVVGGMLSFGVILLSFIFPALVSSFIFLGLMLVFAAGAILYETSKVINDYPTDKYVAASLALFASAMLLFWYILRIMLRIGGSK